MNALVRILRSIGLLVLIVAVIAGPLVLVRVLQIRAMIAAGQNQVMPPETVTAAPVSAQNPLRGFSRVRRPPMVRTIRHPPLMVPRAIAEYAAINTQAGIVNVF